MLQLFRPVPTVWQQSQVSTDTRARTILLVPQFIATSRRRSPEPRSASVRRAVIAKAAVKDLNCPHFSECSGCVIEKDLTSPPILTDAAEFFTKDLGLPLLPSTFLSVHGWRLRARLAVRGPPQKPIIGLYSAGTHKAIDLTDCRCAYSAQLLLSDAGLRQSVLTKSAR